VTRARQLSPGDADAELVTRAAEGDATAYRELVARHAARLHQYALRLTRNAHEAEDVLQEAWLRVWQRAADYEPTARVTTWLHRIVHNLAVDKLRVRGRFSELTEEEPAPSSTEQPALLEAKRDAQTLRAAIDRLPERQAAALSLVHLSGLSPEEAQEVLGVSAEALESLLSRGRRKLKDELTAPRKQHVAN